MDNETFSIPEIEAKIEQLLQLQIFDERDCKIICYHFGIRGESQKKPREISRLIKVPLKKTQIDIKRLETKVFNLLKSK